MHSFYVNTRYCFYGAVSNFTIHAKSFFATNYMNHAKHIPMQTHIHTSLLLSLSLSLSFSKYLYLHTLACQKAERVPLQTAPDDSTYTQFYCSMATKTRSMYSIAHFRFPHLQHVLSWKQYKNWRNSQHNIIAFPQCQTSMSTSLKNPLTIYPASYCTT